MTVNTLEERIAWLWAALIAFSAPEIGLFLRSARICFFKTVRKPKWGHFIIVSTYLLRRHGSHPKKEE